MDNPCTNPECARVRLELQLAQEELQRIKSAGYDMLKQRGVWQSAGKVKTHKDLGLEFEEFFDHDAENALECLTDKSSLAEEVARRLLCNAFQIAYEKCKEQILRKMEEVLNRILSIGRMIVPAGDSSSEDLYDACRAYGLLLHASGLARSPQHQVSQEVCKEVLDEMALADLEVPPDDEMTKFVSSACHLTWNLLTTVPPLMCARPNTAFCKECHQKELTPLWNKEIESYELVYYRPVLFLDYDGKVARKGLVGNKPCDSPVDTAGKEESKDQTKDVQHAVKRDDKGSRRETHSEQPSAIPVSPTKQLPALLNPSTQVEPTPSSSAKDKDRSKLPSKNALPQKCPFHSGERAVKTHQELLKALTLSDHTATAGHSGGGVASKPSKVNLGTRTEDKPGKAEATSQEAEPNAPGKFSYTPLWLWK